MKINEDSKIDILRDLLKERYEASHKMRDRSLKFAIWVLGFGIALICSFCRVGPSQAIDIVNEGQINGTFWGLTIAFSYLKSCS